MFDLIQGDHLVLTTGINISKYAGAHSEIVSSKLNPYAKRLETVLQGEKEKEVANEVRLLMHHHLYQYQKQNIFIPY